jgi:hypothetical protein
LFYEPGMGFFDSGARKARERQLESLRKEAAAAGSTITSVTEDVTEKSGAGGTLVSMFGGTHDITAIQLIELTTRGIPHVYVQPYNGVAALPGEHHVTLPGSVPAPAVLHAKKLFRGPKWESPDEGFAEQLSRAFAGLDFAWEWKSGFTVIELAWALQLRASTPSTTEVVLRAGRYGGFTTYEVGFSTFARVLGTSMKLVSPAPVSPQDFIVPVAWSTRDADEVDDADGDDDAIIDVPPVSKPFEAPPPRAATDIIRDVIAKRAGKRIHLAPFAAKVDTNVREHVMPAAKRAEPIVAIVDLTVFGSAKDAVVVTPTHLYAKELDDRAEVELASVRRIVSKAGAFGGSMRIEVAGLGEIKLPVGGEGDVVHELLEAIIATNPPSPRI